jgi:hypothetical protein
MSVDSPPLGATRSGTFELRAPALEALEARTVAPRSWLGLVGLAGLLVSGLLVAISAAGTDKLLPQTLRVGTWAASA